MDLLVVFSQFASGTRGRSDPLESLLRRYFKVRFLHPRDQDELEAAIRESLGDGTRAVLVAGGDGTVNQVVNALGSNPLPIAILPSGTANDFSRELGFSSEGAELVARIQSGRIQAIDLLEVNGKLFCTIGGLGLPAHGALDVSRWRHSSRFFSAAVKVLGAGVYHLSVGPNILFRREITSEIQLSYRAPGASRESYLEAATSGVFVANQKRLAGGLCVSPESRNDDGMFEIILLPAGPRTRLLRHLFKLARGNLFSPGEVISCRAVEARLCCPKPCAFFGDGELLETASEFRISTRPGQLKVLY